MLERVSDLFGASRVRDLRGRLSQVGEQAIAAEWEIAVIYALSHEGTVEPIEGREGNPDLIFSPKGGGDDRILVEITSLSDVGAEQKTSFESFRSDMERYLVTKGLLAHGAISCEVGIDPEVKDHYAPAIPSRKSLSRVFEWEELQVFTSEIRARPMIGATAEISRDRTYFKLRYFPGEQGMVWRFPNYRAVRNPQRNVIINRLQKKKAQLKKAKEDLPAVVILCDNDCYAVSSAVSINPPNNTVHDLARIYLNDGIASGSGRFLGGANSTDNFSRISGVLILRVEEDCRGKYSRESGERENRYKVAQSFVEAGRAPKFPLRADVIRRMLGSFARLPPPQELPSNAKKRSVVPAKYGEFSVEYDFESKKTLLKLSLMTLQKLLCGEISHEVFLREYENVVKALKVASKGGRMISRLSIEESEHQDDDWVVIELGKVDPAAIFRSIRTGDK